MIASKAVLPTGVLLASIFMLGGCAADRVDLAKANRLNVEGTSTKLVAVEQPSVWQEGGQTVVYGHVKRAPDAFTVGAGHTHVQVELPDSGIVEEQWVPWAHKYIPFRAPGYTTYTAPYPWIIPPGSTVRAWVCFDEHPSIPGGNAPTAKRRA